MSTRHLRCETIFVDEVDGVGLADLKGRQDVTRGGCSKSVVGDPLGDSLQSRLAPQQTEDLISAFAESSNEILGGLPLATQSQAVILTLEADARCLRFAEENLGAHLLLPPLVRAALGRESPWRSLEETGVWETLKPVKDTGFHKERQRSRFLALFPGVLWEAVAH
jgi:hypothetical protein